MTDYLPISQIESTVRVLRECISTRERSCCNYPCDACTEDRKILATVRLIRDYLDQLENIVTGEDAIRVTYPDPAEEAKNE